MLEKFRRTAKIGHTVWPPPINGNAKTTISGKIVVPFLVLVSCSFVGSSTLRVLPVLLSAQLCALVPFLALVRAPGRPPSAQRLSGAMPYGRQERSRSRSRRRPPPGYVRPPGFVRSASGGFGLDSGVPLQFWARFRRASAVLGSIPVASAVLGSIPVAPAFLGLIPVACCSSWADSGPRSLSPLRWDRTPRRMSRRPLPPLLPLLLLLLQRTPCSPW